MKNLIKNIAIFCVIVNCDRQSIYNLDETWDSRNDPFILGSEFKYEFAGLPLNGQLDSIPWSDTYWPSRSGGVGVRWRDINSDAFSYQSPNSKQIEAMSLAERSRLSPAEKYDAFVGNYSYPTVASERKRTRPDAPGWEGLCHGWSPAALNFSEPKPIIIKSADGIEIPFGSSDIKALLTIYQGNFSNARSKMLGGRCNINLANDQKMALSPECKDVNAGAFHVVLTNMIGLQKRGFVADVTRDLEVWNQPVYGYSSTVVGTQNPSPGASPGTVSEVRIQTVMNYTGESMPTWLPVIGTPENFTGYKTYDYRLELDQDGKIVGGEWLNDSRPDFLWIKEKPEFVGNFAPLGQLYEASLASQGLPDPDPSQILTWDSLITPPVSTETPNNTTAAPVPASAAPPAPVPGAPASAVPDTN